MTRLLPRRLSLVLALTALLTSTIFAEACTHAPPALSPTATLAFTNHQIQNDLDRLRDTAVVANAQVPPLVSSEATRKVVAYHEAAIKTIHATRSGWQATLLTGLDELATALSPPERQILAPYVALVRTVLAEVR